VGLGFSVFAMLIVIELFGSPFLRNISVIIALMFGKGRLGGGGGREGGSDERRQDCSTSRAEDITGTVFVGAMGEEDPR
jgi:hypothetical protein